MAGEYCNPSNRKIELFSPPVADPAEGGCPGFSTAHSAQVGAPYH